MSNRKLISGTLATTSVLVALGIAVGVNLVASQMNLRLDLTKDQIYTLSPVSRQAVSDLTEPVEIKVFVSPDMPAPFHTLGSRVSDVLSEYASASGGMVTFQVIEPPEVQEGKASALEETARGYGCARSAIGQQTEHEVSLRAVFKCVAFVQGDRQQVIRDLHVTGRPELDHFEYRFTKALLNLKATSSRKVGFVSGFGGVVAEPGFMEAIQPTFEGLYGKLLEPALVNLATTPHIPEDVTALVIFQPTETFSTSAKYALDQFLKRGGSLGWYQSSSKPVGGERVALDVGLGEVFEKYGVRHNRDLILDRERALSFGVVETPNGLAQVSHPATFQINNIERRLPFLASSPPLAIPGPSSLTVTPVGEVQAWEAFRSAPSSVQRKGAPKTMDWASLRTPEPGETQGSYVLGAALQGVFPSAYEERPEGVDATLTYGGKRKPGRVFVVGSGEFFLPDASLGYDARLAGVGQQMWFGSMEWLAQDASLSTIRVKSMPRFVGGVGQETQRRIQFINIVFVPALFLLIGIGMRWRRERRRNTLTL